MTCCIVSRTCCSTVVVAASTDGRALDDSSQLGDDAVSDVWRAASADSGVEKALFSGSHGNIPINNKVNDTERVNTGCVVLFILRSSLLLHDESIGIELDRACG
jgi:hypothetical protein